MILLYCREQKVYYERGRLDQREGTSDGVNVQSILCHCDGLSDLDTTISAESIFRVCLNFWGSHINVTFSTHHFPHTLWRKVSATKKTKLGTSWTPDQSRIYFGSNFRLRPQRYHLQNNKPRWWCDASQGPFHSIIRASAKWPSWKIRATIRMTKICYLQPAQSF